MSPSNPSVLNLLLRKYETRAPFNDADREALLGLPVRVQQVEANTYVVREGDRPDHSCVILEGFATRHKMTEFGGRQILSFHLDGDIIDLEGSLLNIADHNVQTLTRCKLGFIPRLALRELISTYPKVGMAMWIDTLIDASIFREWILNVGRREGYARVAHVLCEFGRRLELAGLSSAHSFDLPMTQEQLGDATGLSTIHINRVLKRLTEEQLIKRNKRALHIPNWQRLRDAAGFSELYLHLDQITRGYREDRAL